MNIIFAVFIHFNQFYYTRMLFRSQRSRTKNTMCHFFGVVFQFIDELANSASQRKKRKNNIKLRNRATSSTFRYIVCQHRSDSFKKLILDQDLMEIFKNQQKTHHRPPIELHYENSIVDLSQKNVFDSVVYSGKILKVLKVLI